MDTHASSELPQAGGGLWRIVICLTCLTILVLGLVRQVAPQPFQAPDFFNTYRASTALRDGTDLYAPAVEWVSTYQRGQRLRDQYFYAPTYALLLSPLTLVPYQAAIQIWGACLLAFLCLAVYALFRASDASPPSLTAVLVVATAASLMSAVRAEYFLGQANLFMLACIACAMWARHTGRPVWAGMLLGLALVTKPMLLLIAVFLLWKREFKFAIATVASFLTLLVAPFLWLGLPALRNLLYLWRFYGSQYLSFIENIAPRGMLERLLTVNPYVVPLADLPALASGLWLIVVAVVFALILAVVAPQPLRRTPHGLVEVGLLVSGLMLVSPLTEPPYLVLLIAPLVSTLLFLHAEGWTQRRYRWAAAGLALLWFAELVPRNSIEPFFWAHLSTSEPFEAFLLVVFSPTHFYILLGTFLLQLYVLGLASGRMTFTAVGSFVRNLPDLAREWVRDAVAASPI